MTAVAPPLLIDSHCHLDFPDFDGDLDGVVTRAQEAGVGHMVTICTHVTKFDQVRAVAEGRPEISCTVGIHPHQAGSEPEVSADRLVELADHPKVVGIGETGLDFFYDNSPRDAQEVSFRRHIEAARRTDLPLIVHTRDADADTVRVLKECHDADGPFPGLIHCFSAGQGLADAVLEMGFYISVSGIVTFNKAEPIRNVLKSVPLDRLLVETDSPYLAPVPRRGKRNEPAYTAHTAQRLADVKGVSAEQLAQATTANFLKLFKKAQVSGAAS